MKTFNWLYRIVLRFRYPVTLPEDIAGDLGITVSNFLSFKDFVGQLTNQFSRPERVKRFMQREAVEAAFESAQRKERFCRSSIFSYYIHEGWLEFKLDFDEQSRLRRVYLQHKYVDEEQGIEIPLHQDPITFPYQPSYNISKKQTPIAAL